MARVPLDECVPCRLRDDLTGHEVRTVPEMGWASLKNGDLLRLAEPLFDVFVTSDQRLSYQQSVASLQLAVVVLVAKRNKLEFLRPLVPALLDTIREARHGEVRFARPSVCHAFLVKSCQWGWNKNSSVAEHFIAEYCQL